MADAGGGAADGGCDSDCDDDDDDDLARKETGVDGLMVVICVCSFCSSVTLDMRGCGLGGGLGVVCSDEG